MSPALLANLVLTLLLTGVIWTIQVVHYPLFAAVPSAELAGYARAHGRRIGRLVVPLMSLELAAAVWLVLRPPPGVPPWAGWAGLALVCGIWLVTAAVFVPLHGRLASRAGAGDLKLLVLANWCRTLGWSARAGLLLWLAIGVG